LNSTELINKNKFLHFRPVQNKDKKDIINMGEANSNYNFLDSIDQDPIKGKENGFKKCLISLIIFKF
jgi:hypothetical protein